MAGDHPGGDTAPGHEMTDLEIRRDVRLELVRRIPVAVADENLIPREELSAATTRTLDSLVLTKFHHTGEKEITRGRNVVASDQRGKASVVDAPGGIGVLGGLEPGSIERGDRHEGSPFGVSGNGRTRFPALRCRCCNPLLSHPLSFQERRFRPFLIHLRDTGQTPSLVTGRRARRRGPWHLTSLRRTRFAVDQDQGTDPGWGDGEAGMIVLLSGMATGTGVGLPGIGEQHRPFTGQPVGSGDRSATHGAVGPTGRSGVIECQA